MPKQPDSNNKPILKPSMPSPLREGIDYIIENGFWVFTAKYLKERGYCCGNGCKNCPYQD